jgi:hypothetical protein
MKVIVGMATTNARLEFAQLACESLVNQVDELNVYNNDTATDYTDNAKFLMIGYHDEPVYFFTCDDDIIYPPTYVEDMIAKIKEHGTIVTHHGRRLKAGHRYYKQPYGYSCLAFNPRDYLIDVAGTGCTAFNTEYFKPTEIYKSKFLRMADLVFSLEAIYQNKKITVLAHPKGYLTTLPVPRELTIYHMEQNNTQQDMLMSEILDLKTKSN